MCYCKSPANRGTLHLRVAGSSLCFVTPHDWFASLSDEWSAGVWGHCSSDVAAVVCRWCQTGARHVPWRTHVSAARLAAALAVLGSSSRWPIKLSLHSMDWPRHGVQADWAGGGELDRQHSLTSCPVLQIKLCSFGLRPYFPSVFCFSSTLERWQKGLAREVLQLGQRCG